jgi:hypothetical protein
VTRVTNFKIGTKTRVLIHHAGPCPCVSPPRFFAHGRAPRSVRSSPLLQPQFSSIDTSQLRDAPRASFWSAAEENVELPQLQGTGAFELTKQHSEYLIKLLRFLRTKCCKLSGTSATTPCAHCFFQPMAHRRSPAPFYSSSAFQPILLLC